MVIIPLKSIFIAAKCLERTETKRKRLELAHLKRGQIKWPFSGAEQLTESFKKDF